MKLKTAAVAMTLSVSAFTSYAGGDNAKIANDFRQAAKEYAQQAEGYYKQASSTKGEARNKLLSAAKMSDQLAEIKLKISALAGKGDWGSATKKLIEEYHKVSSARCKVLWGDHKDKKH